MSRRNAVLAPGIPGQRAAEHSHGDGADPMVTPTVLAASYQHCWFLQQKISNLSDRLAQSREQYFYAVAREYRLGHLTEAELAVIYNRSRQLGQGVMTQWDAIVPVNGRRLLARHYDRIKNAPNGPDGRYWTGAYPFELGEPAPTDGTPVVYVLYNAGMEPVYLGSTGHFRTRVKWHFKENGIPVAFWLACPATSREAAYLWEDTHLKTLMPPMNKRRAR